MRNVYFVLVRQQDAEELIILYVYITDKPAYKNCYMAHILDAANDEILFYESHVSPDVLKIHIEACIEELGYIIFSYNEYAFPGFQWYG